MSVDLTVATRFPGYATAMGRAVLAGLEPVERTRVIARTELKPLTRYTVTLNLREDAA